MALAAVGVVFGDIGTSPLYSMRECLTGRGGRPLDEPGILGVASLVLWVLVIVVAVKYAGFVMRADNRGEGGILALTALAYRLWRRRALLTTVIGCLGAALFFGDGLITPAISVLSAAEGLAVAIAGTMTLTSALVWFVAVRGWRWSVPKATLVAGAFLCVDLALLAGTLLKFVDGGWLPVTIGVVLLFVMMTWRLWVHTLEVPRVSEPDRAVVEALRADILHVELRYGFMEEHDVPRALCAAGLDPSFDLANATYFVGHASWVQVDGGRPRALASAALPLHVPQRRPRGRLLPPPARARLRGRRRGRDLKGVRSDRRA